MAESVPDKVKSYGYKAVQSVKNDGMLVTARRGVGKVKKQINKGSIKIETMAAYDDILDADWINSPYKAPGKKKRAKGQKMNIAWVLSPLHPGAGGHNTIFRFVRHLESKGHTCTIYLYEGIMPQAIADARNVAKYHYPPMEAQIRRLADFEADGDTDIVFATGWETAYPVFNLQTDAHKMYFIQDFEPMFYGTGSRTVLAENTYKFGFKGITAGEWLTRKVGGTYGMDCDFFDFGSDPTVYKNAGKKERKVISYYARPVTERRAFELGIMALDIFKRKHPEYEIHMFGWDVGAYKIPFKYVNHKIVSPAQLNEIYNDSAACLVMSLTNASLLPLEVLSSGAIPVMNDGDNNRLIVKNDYVEYCENTPHALANGLENVINRKDATKYAKKASDSVSALTWDIAGDKVEKILLKEIFE